MLYYLNWRLNPYSEDFLEILRITHQKDPKEKYLISKEKYCLIDNLDLINHDIESIKSTRITMNKISNIIYYVIIEKRNIVNNNHECKIFLTSSKSVLTSEIKLMLRDYKYYNHDDYNYDFDKIEKLIDSDIRLIKKHHTHIFDNSDASINYTIRTSIKNLI